MIFSHDAQMLKQVWNEQTVDISPTCMNLRLYSIIFQSPQVMDRPQFLDGTVIYHNSRIVFRAILVIWLELSPMYPEMTTIPPVKLLAVISLTITTTYPLNCNALQLLRAVHRHMTALNETTYMYISSAAYLLSKIHPKFSTHLLATKALYNAESTFDA